MKKTVEDVDGESLEARKRERPNSLHIRLAFSLWQELCELKTLSCFTFPLPVFVFFHPFSACCFFLSVLVSGSFLPHTTVGLVCNISWPAVSLA